MDRDEYRRMAAAETAHWWYGATRALLQDLLAARLGSGMRIVDAGCGTGAAGGWLGEYGVVVGIDAEPLALELYREARPAARLVRADLTRLPLAAGRFDLVVCVTVLYHEQVKDPAAAIRGFAAALKPEGILCLLEPGLPGLRRGHDRVTHTARRFGRVELRSLVEAAGLEIVRSTAAYSFLAPPAAVKAILERGRKTSDLGGGDGGLGGLLPAVAALERRWLRRRDLPLGLSVVAIGRKPAHARSTETQ
jgi:SAM-dependent methyltransferase